MWDTWFSDGVKATKNLFKDKTVGYHTDYSEPVESYASNDIVVEPPTASSIDIGESSAASIEAINTSSTIPGSLPGATTAPATASSVKANKKSSSMLEQIEEQALLNDLNVFASFNYIFTLYALTVDEVNNNTYRREEPRICCLRAGGGRDISGGFGLEKYDGKFDYFIDNVNIECLISASPINKQSNATKITFDVFEPLSMGQFPLVLMKSAKEARGGEDVNYLSSPYLLTVDFLGWDDDGKEVGFADTRHLRRMFPLYLTDVRFEVTEKGSQYTIEAIPWNEQASLYQNQSLSQEITLKGQTVKDMCQTGLYAISTEMNEQQQILKAQSDGQYIPDEYIIVFPPEDEDKSGEKPPMFANAGGYSSSEYLPPFGGLPAVTKKSNTRGASDGLNSARIEQYYRESLGVNPTGTDLARLKQEIKEDVGVSARRSDLGEIGRLYADSDPIDNEIGKAVLVETNQDHVKHPFLKPLYAEVTGKTGVFDRRKVTIQDGLCEMNFQEGSTIFDMIEEIILMSSYGRELAEQTPNAQGFYKWFRIEIETYPISSENIKGKGRAAMLYVYRVVPYLIHKSRYQPVSSSVDYSKLAPQIKKVYNYQYTGKNDAVLDFKIEYNKAYFVAMSHAYDTRAGAQTQSADSRGSNPVQATKAKNQGSTKPESQSGQREMEVVSGAQSGRKGGGAGEKVGSAVARDWNDIYLNSPVDLINCQLTILGDPYFITDSGMGNYHAKVPAGETNITEDGTMSFENGEVHIAVNFKSPIDYPYDASNDLTDSGYMDFSDNNVSVKGFSGVYQVITVINQFNNGEFKQVLRLVRNRNQEKIDTQETAKDEKNVKDANKVVEYVPGYASIYT